MSTVIKKQNLIDRFTSRVRDYITANTQWVGGTAVWNTNVATVVANSTVYGGGFNRTAASDTTAQPQPLPANFSDKVSSSNSGAGAVVSTIKNLLVSYANNHRVYFLNTGNYTPADYSGTVRLNDTVQATKNAIISDVDAAAVERGITDNSIVLEDRMNSFFEDCKNIWITRCMNPNVEEFRYSYCHNSCHSNHNSHGSRGRR